MEVVEEVEDEATQMSLEGCRSRRHLPLGVLKATIATN